jgi:hypothetical protein
MHVRDARLKAMLFPEDQGRPHDFTHEGPARDDREILVLIRVLRCQEDIE